MTDTLTDPEHMSTAALLAEVGTLDELLDDLSDDAIIELAHDWRFWRRPSQALPDPNAEWDTWMIRAGRGYGKTRTGGEAIRELVEEHGVQLLGACSPTAGDARDVLVEGESGIMECASPNFMPTYEPSKRRVTWPNGARLTLFSGEKPNRLRGPQHEAFWIDEPASMPLGAEVLDNARLGLRLGMSKLIVTGTPRRLAWLRELEDEDRTRITTGSTYDNIVNLSPTFVRMVLGRYEGTRLGRQELHAEYLDDVEGALWVQRSIDEYRITAHDATNPWISLRAELMAIGHPIPPDDNTKNRPWRTIVAVDPPGETAECGIVIGTAPQNGKAGIDHAVILADESMTGRPEEWGQAVVSAYRYWNAQAVYVESNQGGDMVRSTIHAIDSSVPVKKVTAKESKAARAEPVSALYEKGWIHHVDYLPKLEDQQTGWVPPEYGGKDRSPDRLDALVHCVRELLDDDMRWDEAEWHPTSRPPLTPRQRSRMRFRHTRPRRS